MPIRVQDLHPGDTAKVVGVIRRVVTVTEDGPLPAGEVNITLRVKLSDLDRLAGEDRAVESILEVAVPAYGAAITQNSPAARRRLADLIGDPKLARRVLAEFDINQKDA